MSAWPRPTTADIGLRAFSSSPSKLMVEAALGMQGILASEEAAKSINSLVRHNSQWNFLHQGDDFDLLLIQWLEEVLYRCEVHDQWLVDAMLKITDTEVQAMVSWVDANRVEREVEIKAVTSHQLLFEQVMPQQEISSEWPEVPSFQGPGWYCDVIFDI